MAYIYVGSAFAASSTVSYSPTAGNTVAIVVGNSVSSGTPSVSLTDNLSTSYNTAASALIPSNFDQTSVFYLTNIPAGITSFAASWSGGGVGSTKQIAVIEYSGLGGYLGIATILYLIAPGAGTNGMQTNTVSVSTQPACLIGIAYDVSGSNPCTAGTSPIAFTSRLSSAGKGITLEDARVTSTGNLIATFTSQNGGNNYQITAMAFYESGASAGTSGSLGLMGMGS